MAGRIFPGTREMKSKKRERRKKRVGATKMHTRDVPFLLLSRFVPEARAYVTLLAVHMEARISGYLCYFVKRASARSLTLAGVRINPLWKNEDTRQRRDFVDCARGFYRSGGRGGGCAFFAPVMTARINLARTREIVVFCGTSRSFFPFFFLFFCRSRAIQTAALVHLFLLFGSARAFEVLMPFSPPLPARCFAT